MSNTVGSLDKRANFMPILRTLFVPTSHTLRTTKPDFAKKIVFVDIEFFNKNFDDDINTLLRAH